MKFNITIAEKQELDVIESDIKQEINRVAVSILKIGDRLIRAKEILKHGQFQEWVDANFVISYRAATNYMRAARAFPEEKRKSISFLKSTQVLLLAELPEETRDTFITDNDVSGMSTRELKAAIGREKVMRYFASTEEEGRTEFEIDVDTLKPLPEYAEYPFLQRSPIDYVRFMDWIKEDRYAPILITKNNYVIDGMERVRAVKDLGHKRIRAHYLFVKNPMSMSFDALCLRYFYDMKRWDFSRTSLFYYFSAFYHAIMGDREAVERDLHIYLTEGAEIDRKYKEQCDRAQAVLDELENKVKQGGELNDADTELCAELNKLFGGLG